MGKSQLFTRETIRVDSFFDSVRDFFLIYGIFFLCAFAAALSLLVYVRANLRRGVGATSVPTADAIRLGNGTPMRRTRTRRRSIDSDDVHDDGDDDDDGGGAADDDDDGQETSWSQLDEIPLLVCAFVLAVAQLWILLAVCAVVASSPHVNRHWLLYFIDQSFVRSLWLVASRSSAIALLSLPFAYFFDEAVGLPRWHSHRAAAAPAPAPADDSTQSRFLEAALVALLFAALLCGVGLASAALSPFELTAHIGGALVLPVFDDGSVRMLVFLLIQLPGLGLVLYFSALGFRVLARWAPTLHTSMNARSRALLTQQQIVLDSLAELHLNGLVHLTSVRPAVANLRCIRHEAADGGDASAVRQNLPASMQCNGGALTNPFLYDDDPFTSVAAESTSRVSVCAGGVHVAAWCRRRRVVAISGAADANRAASVVASVVSVAASPLVRTLARLATPIVSSQTVAAASALPPELALHEHAALSPLRAFAFRDLVDERSWHQLQQRQPSAVPPLALDNGDVDSGDELDSRAQEQTLSFRLLPLQSVRTAAIVSANSNEEARCLLSADSTLHAPSVVSSVATTLMHTMQRARSLFIAPPSGTAAVRDESTALGDLATLSASLPASSVYVGSSEHCSARSHSHLVTTPPRVSAFEITDTPHAGAHSQLQPLTMLRAPIHAHAATLATTMMTTTTTMVSAIDDTRILTRSAPRSPRNASGHSVAVPVWMALARRYPRLFGVPDGDRPSADGVAVFEAPIIPRVDVSTAADATCCGAYDVCEESSILTYASLDTRRRRLPCSFSRHSPLAPPPSTRNTPMPQEQTEAPQWCCPCCDGRRNMSQAPQLRLRRRHCCDACQSGVCTLVSNAFSWLLSVFLAVAPLVHVARTMAALVRDVLGVDVTTSLLFVHWLPRVVFGSGTMAAEDARQVGVALVAADVLLVVHVAFAIAVGTASHSIARQQYVLAWRQRRARTRFMLGASLLVLCATAALPLVVWLLATTAFDLERVAPTVANLLPAWFACAIACAHSAHVLVVHCGIGMSVDAHV